MSLGQEVFLDELHQIFLSLASEVRPTGGPLPGDLSSPPVFEVVPIGVVLFLGHCVAPGGASRSGRGRCRTSGMTHNTHPLSPHPPPPGPSSAVAAVHGCGRDGLWPRWAVAE